MAMSERGAWLIGSFVASLLVLCGIAWTVGWMLEPIMQPDRMGLIVEYWSGQ